MEEIQGASKGKQQLGAVLSGVGGLLAMIGGFFQMTGRHLPGGVPLGLIGLVIMLIGMGVQGKLSKKL